MAATSSSETVDERAEEVGLVRLALEPPGARLMIMTPPAMPP